jgi:hypothetical protein
LKTKKSPIFLFSIHTNQVTNGFIRLRESWGSLIIEIQEKFSPIFLKEPLISLREASL